LPLLAGGEAAVEIEQLHQVDDRLFPVVLLALGKAAIFAIITSTSARVIALPLAGSRRGSQPSDEADGQRGKECGRRRMRDRVEVRANRYRFK
jgi:hypothetical protein